MSTYIVYLTDNKGIAINSKNIDISPGGKYLIFYDERGKEVARFVTENIIGYVRDGQN